MKQGDEIMCPYCKKDSFLVKKKLTEGWLLKGEILVCSICSQKIADIKGEGDGPVSGSIADEKISKFAAFIGEEKATRVAILTTSEGEGAFCRDCKYYISHPFMNRCTLTSKEVNPMDDCSEFASSQK